MLINACSNKQTNPRCAKINQLKGKGQAINEELNAAARADLVWVFYWLVVFSCFMQMFLVAVI